MCVTVALTVAVFVRGCNGESDCERDCVCDFVCDCERGCDYDSVKHKTKTIPDNGLNPVWEETFKLRILNPEMALIRFSIYDEDMFGDPNFIGHATYPVKLLVSGYRSIQV